MAGLGYRSTHHFFFRRIGDLRKLYKEHRGKIDFYWIYTREPHAEGSMAPCKYATVKQPETLAERKSVAATAAKALQLEMPRLIDHMDDRVARAFTATLSRAYVLSAEGRILFRGESAPLGFDVAKLGRALRKITK